MKMVPITPLQKYLTRTCSAITPRARNLRGKLPPLNANEPHVDYITRVIFLVLCIKLYEIAWAGVIP